MFMQVIQGTVTDPAGFERQAKRWREQVRPGASGYLGSTSGVAPDGTAIVMACFADEEQAMANSGRPEQDAWWQDTERTFSGPVTFRNTTDVTQFGDVSGADAGFVQVIEGRTHDRTHYEQLMADGLDTIGTVRPDIRGMITAWFDDDFVECVYFSSEAEARAGEQAMGGSDQAQQMREMIDLTDDLNYYDLRAPLISAASS